MPNYIKIKIESEYQALKKIAVFKTELDKKLGTPNLPDEIRNPLLERDAKVKTLLDEQIAKILKIFDAGADNAQKRCNYIELVHGQAKVIHGKLDGLLTQLETNFIEVKATEFAKGVTELGECAKLLAQDDSALTLSNQGEYRGAETSHFVDLVPWRKAEFDKAVMQRKLGIDRLNTLVPTANKVTEYITRAKAKLQTVEQLRQRFNKEKIDSGKIRDAALKVSQEIEDSTKELAETLVSACNSIQDKLKLYLGSKTQNKEAAKGVLLIEPRVDRAASDVKAKVKTMRVQIAEQRKALTASTYFDNVQLNTAVRALDKAEESVKTLEGKYKIFCEKDLVDYRLILAKAKLVK